MPGLWPLSLVATALALASVTAPACVAGAPPRTPGAAPILLFAGIGTSPNDVKALESILRARAFGYSLADSGQLNALRKEQLEAYRLLIVPGGNFEEMGNGLTAQTSAAVRSAVQGGLHYLGICAGAFYAGNSPYNGLNLTSGVRFGFYSLENRGIRKAAVAITTPGSPTLDHYWEDGPELSGFGEVVSKYPDGTPAIVQGAVGTGWVLLSGTHPEAPENWREGLKFTTTARAAQDHAATLIRAALDGTRLPHY